MAAGSSYADRAPVPALAGLASSVWVQRVGDEPIAQRYVPHGGAEIRCVLGEAPRLLGPLTAALHRDLPAGATVVGVRLRPGVVGSLTGVPADELTDRDVDGDDLWRDPLPPVAVHHIPVFKKTAELAGALVAARAGFEMVSLRIGTVWGPLGLPDSPFFALPRLLSAAVRGEDPDLTPPRPSAHAEDATDLCYVKDCGRAIALLMHAEQLSHDIYNVSSGELVRYADVVAAIDEAVPGARIRLPAGHSAGRPPEGHLDIGRLQRDTGFVPEYDVRRSVADYAAWLATHEA